MVDGGDTLAPPGEHGDPDAARWKARAIARAFQAGGIDALAVSRRDWALGTTFIRDLVRDHQLPTLAANLTCSGEAPFPAYRVVERDGWRVGLIGVTEGPVEGCEVQDPVPAIRAAAAQLGGVDVRVLLAPGEVSLDLPVDLAVVAVPVADTGVGPIVLGPTPRGKQLGVARLVAPKPVSGWWSSGRARKLQDSLTRAEARLRQLQATPGTTEAQRAFHEARVAELRARAALTPAGPRGDVVESTVELSSTIPDDPEAAAWVAEALQSINARPALAVDVPWTAPPGPFVGAAACQSCHPAEHAQWAATPHAGAYLALVNDQHGRDPACVGCHVTGWKAEGGPQDVATIAGMKDVQCEACHGPARAHAENPMGARPVRAPPLTTCTACHDGDRDGGRFEPGTYLPRVRHDTR